MKKTLKRRLHNMNEQEKKPKDLAKNIVVEKRSSSKKNVRFLYEKIVCNFQYKSCSNHFISS